MIHDRDAFLSGMGTQLQRHLKIGYSRAARLIDNLEENGVIGAADGAKPRSVFVGRE